MFYHASNTPNIRELIPSHSMNDKPLVYLTTKRENALVYLSNAVEKYCKEIGFKHSGKYRKWCSYGFTKGGILELQEYWPDAVVDTYAGVSGYIYSAENVPWAENMQDIPFAVTSTVPVTVDNCEYVVDAYAALQEAANAGLIVIKVVSIQNEENIVITSAAENKVSFSVESIKPFAAYQTLEGPVDSFGLYFMCEVEGTPLLKGDDTADIHWANIEEIQRLITENKFSGVDLPAVLMFLRDGI